MGMSASQARYLSVIARQSDLEYQGQQINQERTVLSQQVSDLYNQLQNMTVPTPPSTTDYTTVQYSGTIGATSYTFDASSIKPSGSDRYVVTVYQDAYGDSVQKNNGYAKVAKNDSTVNVTEVETTDNTAIINQEDIDQYYVSENGGALVPLSSTNLVETWTGEASTSTPVTSLRDDISAPADEDSESTDETSTSTDGTSTSTGETSTSTDETSTSTDGTSTSTGETSTSTDETSTSTDVPSPFTGETSPFKGDISTSTLVTSLPDDTSDSTLPSGSSIFVSTDDTSAPADEDSESTDGTSTFEPVSTILPDESSSPSKKSRNVGASNSLQCTVRLNSGIKLYKLSDDGEPMSVKTAAAGYTVNGHDVYELDNANLTDDQKTSYTAAIENSGLKDSNGKAYTIDDFYFYLDDNGNANFVLRSDVQDKNDTAITYSYIVNGNYKKSQEYEDCTLEFDPSNGRITNLGIPTYDSTGTLTGWTSIDVEATTVTDDTAYQEAYNKYEYNKYLYDKEQQDINAKTEVIQQEDKRLELKLTRLDNERTQITTEVEALDKVINDNIESSYKTFSG